jgi:hypothetical protein
MSGARKYVTLADQSEEGMGPARKFVVDYDGSVFLLDDKTGEENLLDINEIEGANWRRTLVYVLPTMLWNTSVGRFLNKPRRKIEIEEVEEDEASPDQTNGNTLGSGKYTKAEKVGGKRKSKKRN